MFRLKKEDILHFESVIQPGKVSYRLKSERSDQTVTQGPSCHHPAFKNPTIFNLFIFNCYRNNLGLFSSIKPESINSNIT